MPVPVPRIEVDLDAISHNVAVLRRAVERPVLAVVKAGAYGHGALGVARAALAGGADALGVVDVAEGLALRDAGIDAPLVAWLHSPSTDWITAIERDIELGVSSIEQLQLVASAAEVADRPARVHLKLDTGLGRNGAHERDWGALFTHVRQLEADGLARLVGVFSHLSGTSREADLQQTEAFDRARAAATRRGVAPERWHLAATAAGLELAEARFDLVRLGISMYGLSAGTRATPDELGLRPGLRLVAPVVHDANGTRIELGTADGLPALDASEAAGLRIVDEGGNVWRLGAIGTVTTPVTPLAADAETPDARGDASTLLTIIGGGGDGVERDASSADEWAQAASTIGYEIVTRLSARIERRDAATGEPVAQPPEHASRTWRGLLAPRRTLVIDELRLRVGLAEQVAAGTHDFDVSADAYGLGLASVAPLAQDAGLRLVVRTSADARRADEVGIAVAFVADANDATRLAYGFDRDDEGCVRLVSELVLVKRVGPGSGISYGHEFVTTRSTTLGLVPLGYADVFPRRVAGAATLRMLGEAPFDRSEPVAVPRFPIVGRVAMDQVVIDLGDVEAWAGAPVVVFGAAAGDPPLREAAAWAGVEPAAFVAAIGGRVERTMVTGER